MIDENRKLAKEYAQEALMMSTEDESEKTVTAAWCENRIQFLSQTHRTLEDPLEVYVETTKHHNIRGYSFDEELGRLDLYDITFLNGEVTNIPLKDITRSFKSMIGFLEDIQKGKLPVYDESNEEKAKFIVKLKNTITNLTNIKLFFLTDGTTQQADKEVPNQNLVGTKVNIDFQIYDIKKFQQLEKRGSDAAEIEIDFNKYQQKLLTCVKIPVTSDKYDAYLSFISGETLAKIYGEHGQLVLESNVRSYLQAKNNKTNKAIKNTIINDPEKFPAYNNGITTTVDALDTFDRDGVSYIKKIRNFQIVNGGQTTASLHALLKTYPENVAKITVPMKILQIKGCDEESEDMVVAISRASNTQTPVKTSDFSSNNPFHRKMEALSRNTFTPETTNILTKWFYERTNGQYNVEKFKYKSGSPADQRKFETLYPSDKRKGKMSHKFNKLELGRFEMAYQQRPDIVSKGGDAAYSNFIDGLPNDESFVTEQYFKDSIAKAILWWKTHLIYTANHSSEYSDIRSRIIPYSISYLIYITRGIDLDAIWKNQDLTSDYYEPEQTENGKTIYIGYYPELIEYILNQLLKHCPLIGKTVLQGAKQESIWNKIKSQPIPQSLKGTPNLIIGPTGTPYKSDNLSESDRQNIRECENYGVKKWRELIYWGGEKEIYEPWQISMAGNILQWITDGKAPSVKMAIQGVKMIRIAESEGFNESNIYLD